MTVTVFAAEGVKHPVNVEVVERPPGLSPGASAAANRDAAHLLVNWMQRNLAQGAVHLVLAQLLSTHELRHRTIAEHVEEGE